MLEHWAYPSLAAITWGLGTFFARAWDRQKPLWAQIAIPGYLVLLIFWALLVHLNVALRGSDEKNYRWSLKFSTSNPMRYNMGILLLSTGRPLEAAAYFEAVRVFYPDNPDNMHALARSYWDMGQHKTAYYMLKRSVKRFPQHQPSTQSFEKMHVEMGKK
jgi:hypothetical protein